MLKMVEEKLNDKIIYNIYQNNEFITKIEIPPDYKEFNFYDNVVLQEKNR